MNGAWAETVRRGAEVRAGRARDARAAARLAMVRGDTEDLLAGLLAAMAEVDAGESVEDAQRVGWAVVERLAQPEDAEDPFDGAGRCWQAMAQRAIGRAARMPRLVARR